MLVLIWHLSRQCNKLTPREASVQMVSCVRSSCSWSASATYWIRVIQSVTRINLILLAVSPCTGDATELDKVVGHKACFDCHKSETAALLRTQHWQSLQKLQAAPNSKVYAAKLEIDPARIAVADRCTTCHGTRQQTRHEGERVISSVSCESCHGPAGGEDGWLNRHAVYGVKGTKMDEETEEHRHARIEHCEQAGMIRASQLYQIAKNCLQCHMVPDERLVNQGGHKADYQFDLVGHSQGEVRHNFHLDPSQNAAAPTLFSKRNRQPKSERHRLMLIVGEMVELEMSLANLATVTTGQERDQFAKDMGRRAADARDFLEEAVELIEDEGGVVPDAITSVLDRVESLKLKRRLNRRKLAQAAESVGTAARRFATQLDGRQLSAVDELLPVRPKGSVYSP